MNTYTVTTYSIPGTHSGGGKFRRPCDVVIILGERATQRRYCQRAITVARNVDSRYTGPRSAYGQAIIGAQNRADELNAA